MTWFNVGVLELPEQLGDDSQLVQFDIDGATGTNFDVEFNYDLFASDRLRMHRGVRVSGSNPRVRPTQDPYEPRQSTRR